LKHAWLHNTGNFRRSAGRAIEGNFQTGLEQKGQFGRIDRAGQWESGEKRLMGLTKNRSTENRYPPKPFGWLRNNLLNLPV
jgi:hypothetical protein